MKYLNDFLVADDGIWGGVMMVVYNVGKYIPAKAAS